MSGSATPTHLAAIMFTDIAGYSRLMEEDEERTIRLLKAHNDIVLPLIEGAGGDVIDAIGDGLFVLFPSVLTAVQCGVRIQEALSARNATEDERERFRLRVGIHLGEIWRDGDRVYGNGVNVAARVQPFAAPGGICITEDVQHQVANKSAYELRSLGVKELHNIERRVELYQVVTGQEADASLSAADGGELDTVKQRILEARAQVTQRRDAAEDREPSLHVTDSESMESKIESKVYSFVEKVMDKAISKWDEMPEEKKQRAIARIEDAIGERISESDDDLELNIGGKKHVHIGSGGGAKSVRISSASGKKDRKDIASTLSSGLVFAAGFGMGYFYFGINWMIWPFAILGVLPLLSAAGKAFKLRAKLRRLKAERPKEIEKTVLRLARELGGTVTVVQIASAGGLSLEEAQTTLDSMTAKGYVAQNITDAGVIEYEFPSLIG